MRPLLGTLAKVTAMTGLAGTSLIGSAPAPASAAASAPATADAGATRNSGRGDVAGARLVWGLGLPNPGGAGGAYAYDAELVPPGARVWLWSLSLGGRTRTVLVARGLLPGRAYGSHLHNHACTSDPAAAGPHYQQRVGAPDDPESANSRNEVWLALRTDARGAGAAYAVNPWNYRAAPGSVVLHEHSTSDHPGSPGEAGSRVACVTLRAR